MKPNRSETEPSKGMPARDCRAPIFNGSNVLKGLFACLSVALLGAGAHAQSSETGFVSEDYEASSTDENGVDIISGSVRLESQLLSIGPNGDALTYSVITPSLAQTGTSDDFQMQNYGLPINTFEGKPFKFDNYSGGVQLSGINDCNNWFQYGGSRTDFCGSIAIGLIAKDGTNASLIQSGSDFLFTDSQGVQYISALGVARRTDDQPVGLKTITYPSGLVIDIFRATNVITISDNRGLRIRSTTSDGWLNNIVTGYSATVDFCDPNSATCSFSKNWPSAGVFVGDGSFPASATDMTGQVTKLYPKGRANSFTGYFYYKVKPAGAAETATLDYTYCAPWDDNSCGNAPLGCGPGTSYPADVCREFSMVAGKVRTATKNGKTWNYDFWYSEY